MQSGIGSENRHQKIVTQALALLIVPLVLFTILRNSAMAQCVPTTQITNVKYLGKFDAPDGTGKVDKVKIDWTTNAPSPCVKVKTYHFTVKITRRLGIQETSAGVTSNAADRTITVIFKREPLETDPQSYTVVLNQGNVAKHVNGLLASGSGTPTLAGAQITNTFPLNPAGEPNAPPAQCRTALSYDSITFLPANPPAAAPKIQGNWSATPPACVPLKEFKLQGVVNGTLTGQLTLGPQSRAGQVIAATPVQTWSLEVISTSEFAPPTTQVQKTGQF